MADIALVLLIVLLCLCALTVCKGCIVHAARIVVLGSNHPSLRKTKKKLAKLPPPSQRVLRTKQEMDCFLDGSNDGL